MHDDCLKVIATESSADITLLKERIAWKSSSKFNIFYLEIWRFHNLTLWTTSILRKKKEKKTVSWFNDIFFLSKLNLFLNGKNNIWELKNIKFRELFIIYLKERCLNHRCERWENRPPWLRKSNDFDSELANTRCLQSWLKIRGNARKIKQQFYCLLSV